MSNLANNYDEAYSDGYKDGFNQAVGELVKELKKELNGKRQESTNLADIIDKAAKTISARAEECDIEVEKNKVDDENTETTLGELKRIITDTHLVEYKYLLANGPFQSIELPGRMLISLYQTPEEKIDVFIKEKIAEFHSYPRPAIRLIENSIKIRALSKKEQINLLKSVHRKRKGGIVHDMRKHRAKQVHEVSKIQY